MYAMEMVASAKSIEPQKLQQQEQHTITACMYICKSFFATDSLDPLMWGWKLDSSKLQPIMTDLGPAPVSLLKFV